MTTLFTSISISPKLLQDLDAHLAALNRARRCRGLAKISRTRLISKLMQEAILRSGADLLEGKMKRGTPRPAKRRRNR